MKRSMIYLTICLLLLSGCSYLLPTYTLYENKETTVIDGTEYAIHELVYQHQVFVSEPQQMITPENYEKFRVGKRIGKTSNGMDIYRVKNDQKRLIMKGLMFPSQFFILKKQQKK